jgi:hypothetical protein
MKHHRRRLLHYRLRQISDRTHAEKGHLEPVLHFIYDFDYNVVAIDKPRMRFATLTALLTHPKILGSIPRTGRLRPWHRFSATVNPRLNIQGPFAHVITFERLQKEGWKVQGTFLVQKTTVAYVSAASQLLEPRIFSSLANALVAALKAQGPAVRGFLYGFKKEIALHIAAIVVTSSIALSFPLVVAILGDILRRVHRGNHYILPEIAGAIIIAAAAYFFFKIRLSRQRFYGFIELGVGMGMAIASIRSQSTNEPMDLSLKVMAAVYVLIRGMVNIRESGAKAREELRDLARKEHLEVIRRLRQQGA